MAIALDTSTYGSYVNTATSLTFPYTVSGTDRELLVEVMGDYSDLVTGATYNGVSMTLIDKCRGGVDRWLYLFGLVAPATGTHNVVVSASASIYIQGCATSYTGVDQSNPIDSFAHATTSAGDPLTATTTVVATGCWLVGAGRGEVSPVTAGTGTTSRAQETDFNSGGMYDSNGIVGTGSQSLQIDFGGTSQGSLIVVSLTPVAGGGGGGGGDISLNIPAGSLVFEGQYVGVAFLTPPPGHLAFTGYAPTVNIVDLNNLETVSVTDTFKIADQSISAQLTVLRAQATDTFKIGDPVSAQLSNLRVQVTDTIRVLDQMGGYGPPVGQVNVPIGLGNTSISIALALPAAALGVKDVSASLGFDDD